MERSLFHQMINQSVNWLIIHLYAGEVEKDGRFAQLNDINEWCAMRTNETKFDHGN